MLFTKTLIDSNTKFYFAEVESESTSENGMTAIIIDSPDFQQIMYCDVEEAESLAKQLQKHIAMHRMRVNSPPKRTQKKGE